MASFLSFVIFSSILCYSIQLTTAQTGSAENTSQVSIQLTTAQTDSAENTSQDLTTKATSDTTLMTSQTVETTVHYSTYTYNITTMETFNCNSSESSQCLNGGSCMADGRCSCGIGYSGERCESMTDCPPGSCSLMGASECTVNMSTPVCHCLPNYIGTKCEQENICFSRRPCKNNDTCYIDQQGEYSCTCFTGDPDRDCELNVFDDCTLDPPASDDKYIACIDLIVGKKMLCSPGFTGKGCKQERDPADYCKDANCLQDTRVCKPLCNRVECNATKACAFTEFNSERYINVSGDCRKYFADGYIQDSCNTEDNLFDGFDGIRSKLADCSPFFNTVCTMNISDGLCNPHCNNEECLWDGLDCMNETLQTLDGSIIIELEKPLSFNTYSKLSLVLRSGIYYQELYATGTKPKLQLKVVMPAELVKASVNSTVANFTSVGAAGLFLASFLAKLPLDVLDVTDVYVCKAGYYGNKCSKNCSNYCTKEGDICDYMTGQCQHGCRTGWWGDMCLDSCPQGCLGGCELINGKCSSCVDGRYGDGNCSMYCDSYCRHVACNVTTGECDCGDERYFSFENFECIECGEGCYDECDQRGYCTCKSGYFGTRCDGKCSPNCKTGSCDVNGGCSSCKPGFHGDRCEEPCGEGCSECHQDTGACGGNCRDGFVGENCQRSTAKPATDNTGVIVAVVIAIIIILAVIIILVCYFKYRQSGDYIVKDEEDMEPVPKATSLEVKAHYGMQPTHTGTASPLAGHSSEMINMDDPPVGGVYAGPAVTVTFSKEEEAVVLNGANDDLLAKEQENTEQHSDKEQGNQHRDQMDTEKQSPEITMGEDTVKAFAYEGEDVKADVLVEGDMSADIMDNGVVSEEGQEDQDNSGDLNGVRAPLASEEDLTAPVVQKENTSAADNSLDALEHDALDALDHVDSETRSNHSSSSSKSSRHSRSSSASSKSSGKNKDSEEHTLLTEM